MVCLFNASFYFYLAIVWAPEQLSTMRVAGLPMPVIIKSACDVVDDLRIVCDDGEVALAVFTGVRKVACHDKGGGVINNECFLMCQREGR